MKRIFLDTNILIDYIDNRAGADDAEQIFACGFSGEALLFASSLTFSNMAYIIKGRTQEEKYDALRQMAGIVEIVDLRKRTIENVTSGEWKLFPEYSVGLSHSAKEMLYNYSLTKRLTHFENTLRMCLFLWENAI